MLRLALPTMAAGDALQFWKDSVSWFALLHTMAVVACIIVLLAMYSKAKAIVEDALTFDLELFDRIVGRSVIVVLIVDTLVTGVASLLTGANKAWFLHAMLRLTRPFTRHADEFELRRAVAVRVEAGFFALFLAVYGSIIVANVALFASCVGWVCALVISGACDSMTSGSVIDPENVVNGQYLADAMAGYLGGGSPTVTEHTIKHLCKNKATLAHALKHEAIVSAVLLFVQVNLGFVLTHKRRGLSVERPEYSALPTSEL